MPRRNHRTTTPSSLSTRLGSRAPPQPPGRPRNIPSPGSAEDRTPSGTATARAPPIRPSTDRHTHPPSLFARKHQIEDASPQNTQEVPRENTHP